MLTTTKAVIELNGVRLNSSREDFLGSFALSEELLDESLGNVPVYGRDLLMFAEGDLFVNEREFFTSRDLKDVGGLVNYAQAITHRLMTTRGTHPEDRFFGVPWNDYIGSPYVSSRAIQSRLVVDITEELYKDRRTREVQAVETEFTSPTVISVRCFVIPVQYNKEAIQIALSVEDR